MNFLAPWPFKELNPNSRPHWRIKASRVKAYRRDVGILCLAVMTLEQRRAFMAADRLRVTLEFIPPRRGRYDLDNRIASFKAGLDGIADALGLDDNRFTLTASMSDRTMMGGGVRVMLDIPRSHNLCNVSRTP